MSATDLFNFFGGRNNVVRFLNNFYAPNVREQDLQNLKELFLTIFTGQRPPLDLLKFLRLFNSTAVFTSARSFFKDGNTLASFLRNFRGTGTEGGLLGDLQDRFLAIFAVQQDADNLHTILGHLEDNTLYEHLASFGSEELLDIFNNFLTAEDLLGAVLPNCSTSRLTSKSVASSPANELFADDPVFFEQMDFSDGSNATGMAYKRMWKRFHRDMNGIQKRFYDNTYIKMVLLEGDVADICLVNILLPVASVMNAYITHYYYSMARGKEWEIVVRAQYRKLLPINPVTHYIDHCLILQSRGPDKEEHPLVIFEEKIIGAIRTEEWNNLSESNVPSVIPGTTMFREVSKIVPQIRKYVFEAETPYAMTSDAASHIGMVWDAPRGWGCGRWVREYERSRYMKHTEHKCKFIQCLNDEGNGDLPSPRRVLAFLCYLALEDCGFLTR